MKQALSHFTLLHTKSFARFTAIVFHNLCDLLDHTTVSSPQLPSSHSQSNCIYKSAFLDGIVAMNLYILESNCLKKFYTVYLKFLFMCVSVLIYIYTHREDKQPYNLQMLFN